MYSNCCFYIVLNYAYSNDHSDESRDTDEVIDVLQFTADKGVELEGSHDSAGDHDKLVGTDQIITSIDYVQQESELVNLLYLTSI